MVVIEPGTTASHDHGLAALLGAINGGVMDKCRLSVGSARFRT